MLCHWPRSELRGEEITEVWQKQLVTFSDLKTDTLGREWFYNCDGERRTLRLRILKQRIRDYCTEYKAAGLEERDVRWNELVRHAAERGYNFGDRPAEVRFRKLMSSIFSLEEGIPVGFGFSSLISIAHYIYDNHKSLLYYFLYAENAYGRREMLLKAGKAGIWEKRRNEAKRQMRKGGLCEPDRTHDELIRSLFPEVGTLIETRRGTQTG